MQVTIKSITVLSIIALAFTTVPVQAQLEISLDSETEADGSAGIGVEAGTTVDVGTGSDRPGDSEMKKEDGVTMESKTESDTEVSVEVGGVDFRVKNSVETTTSANIITSSDVRSNADLKTYATLVVSENNNIEEVEAKQNRMSITFKERARLFGFIPMRIKNKADVTLSEQSDSRIRAHVQVQKPWWRFLYRAEVKATDLAARIKQNVDTAISAHASVDARTHAKTIDAVETTLRASGNGRTGT